MYSYRILTRYLSKNVHQLIEFKRLCDEYEQNMTIQSKKMSKKNVENSKFLPCTI